jgi:hypothetical protein
VRRDCRRQGHPVHHLELMVSLWKLGILFRVSFECFGAEASGRRDETCPRDWGFLQA